MHRSKTPINSQKSVNFKYINMIYVIITYKGRKKNKAKDEVIDRNRIV